jgi:hypothetical protein
MLKSRMRSTGSGLPSDGANVRMIESGSGAGFAQEAVERLLILGGIRRQELERDVAVEDRVPGRINDAHASASQAFHDAIVRNGLTDHRWAGRITGVVESYVARLGKSTRVPLYPL